MDETLSKALKRKEELEKELVQVQQFIDLYRALFGEEIGENSANASTTEPAKSPEEAPQKRRRRGKPTEIADAAERVIRSLNRPVQRGELVSRIEQEGIEIHSDDKPRYIGTILWRQSERFVNVEGRGYWLTGVPLPDEDGQPNIFE